MRHNLVVSATLGYLLEDMESNPGQLVLISSEFAQRMTAQTHEMDFDPDEPIEGEIDL